MTSYPTHRAVPRYPVPPAGTSPADPLTGSLPRDHHHEDTAGYGAADAAAYLAPPHSAGDGQDDRIWAMLAYLGIVFFAFLPPVAVYLIKQRESPFVRYHAAQALNLWITVFLYLVSFLIISAVLALDSASTALAVGVPLIAASGTAMLVYAVRAALSASRGEMYRAPAWICTPLVK